MTKLITDALVLVAFLLLVLSLLFFLFHMITEEKKEPFDCVEVKDRVFVCTKGVEEQYEGRDKDNRV